MPRGGTALSDRDRCTSCGAKVPAETGVCAYCGTQATHDANVPPPARDRASEKVERFDRLAEHPEFDRWMKWRPDRPETTRSGGGLPAVGLCLIVAGVVFAVSLSSGRSPGPAVIVPLLLIGLGVRRIVRANGDASRPSAAAASARPYPALVVTKRTEMTVEQHARTRYFVTMEFRTGTRREYDVDGAFYGLVADDDLGVAYIREGELLHFKKIDA
jgi:hypothetical protein